MLTIREVRFVKAIVGKYCYNHNLMREEMESFALLRLWQYVKRTGQIPNKGLFYVIVRRAMGDCDRQFRHKKNGKPRDHIEIIPNEFLEQSDTEEDLSNVEEIVEAELRKLTTVQRYCVRHYYGYNKTMQQIADKLGFCQTYINQILNEAFDCMGKTRPKKARAEKCSQSH